MLHRSISLLFVSLAIGLFVSQTAVADDKAHEGTVVKASGGKLTMTFKGNSKQHTHGVARDAKVMLDDKQAKLEDLKAGYHVEVWMDSQHVVTKIQAHSREK